VTTLFFGLINCPRLDSSLPITRAYGVYISQLIGYSRTLYLEFLQRYHLLSNKLCNEVKDFKGLSHIIFKKCEEISTLGCKVSFHLCTDDRISY
jgi:hypothetical protein